MDKSTSTITYNKSIADLINQTIFVIGAPRTGTSFFGNLLASYNNIEFYHEPYFFNNLLNVSREMPIETFKKIFYSYMFEDLFFNSITGRSINTNLNDISSVYNYKSKKEIEKKLHQLNNRNIIIPKYKKNRLAIKIIYPINKFKNIFSKIYDFNKIIIYRNLNDTINSMLRKNWFKNDLNITLMGEFFQIQNNHSFPIFLDKKNFTFWKELNELDKCAFYYLIHYQSINNMSNFISIDYDTFNLNKISVVKEFENKFNLKKGSKTREIINKFNISKSKKDSVSKINKKIMRSIYELKSNNINIKLY